MKTCLEANKAEIEREHVLSTLYYCFCFVYFLGKYFTIILLSLCLSSKLGVGSIY